jgi:hypothetical protein
MIQLQPRNKHHQRSIKDDDMATADDLPSCSYATTQSDG